MSGIDFPIVNQAFTRQSVIYDEYDRQNKTLQWMRKMVREHVGRFIRNGDDMLELNAGTGLDACYFIKQHSVQVHATDLTDGMVAEIKRKISKFYLQDKLTVQQCSYTDLDQVNQGKFDYIFSNFGGLNCLDDLRKVTHHFPDLLQKDGIVTLVIMQPICPWELILALKGKFRYAFRRSKKNGTLAHLEGKYFQTYYFSPADVVSALGKNFRILDLQGLATFTPPPQREAFPDHYPRIFKLLNKLDEKLSRVWPFNTWGDHFIITAKYIG